MGDTSAAVNAGKNAFENNRLATSYEKKIIDSLVKDGIDEHKLDAAACALIKCYTQYANGSEEYIQALALAKEGEQYQDEQVLLQNTKVTVEYTVKANYWNQVDTTVSKEQGGFDYSQYDQIADGQEASDAFKIQYYAKQLNIAPGLIELTANGFNVTMIGIGSVQAGKLSKPGELLGEDVKVTVKNDAGKGNATTNTTKPATGADNAATYPKLKDDLVTQNLDNIAKQDSRLAAVIKGDNGKLDYSVGAGSRAEADRLGMQWVGDGAKRTSGGGWISADGTRGYRPPSAKDSPFATTGTQANFETYLFDSKGKSIKIGNGHLNITD